VQSPGLTSDGYFPVSIDREYEERLVQLAVSGDLDPGQWAAMGPSFFMAGLAVMLASGRNSDRRGLLALAEYLSPGASGVTVFNHWLGHSPLRPSRFFSLVEPASDMRLVETRGAQRRKR
jgi:hypothetical protein